MDSSSRYRFIESPRSVSTPLPVYARSGSSIPGVSECLREAVEESPLYSKVREQVRAIRAERSEPRAVADQHDRPPVGYRTKADLELDVQREGRLQDQRRWARLEPVDYFRALLRRPWR